MDDDVNTDITPTNDAIEALLQAQFVRATELLQQHKTVFLRITQALAEYGEVQKHALAQWLGLAVDAQPNVLEPYSSRLAAFAQQQCTGVRPARLCPSTERAGEELTV